MTQSQITEYDGKEVEEGGDQDRWAWGRRKHPEKIGPGKDPVCISQWDIATAEGRPMKVCQAARCRRIRYRDS